MCPIGFIANMMKADKQNELADKRNRQAFNMISEAEDKLNKKQEETKKSLLKLANRKKGILSTSINEFLDIYEVIMKVDFEEGDGIKELLWNCLPKEGFKYLRTKVDAAGVQMSTSQTIATYMFGDIFNGNFGGISGIIAKEAEMNASLASKRKSHASVIASQAETMLEALDIIKERADRISDLLSKLNLLFRKSLVGLKEIINRNGTNRRLYTRFDKEHIMTSVNLVSTIKKILDTPLLDKEGELTKQSVEAINVGRSYLNKLENLK